MRPETRKFLHDIVAGCLGLPLSKAVWADQEGPRQSVPLAVLRLYSVQAEERENHLRTENPVEIDIRVSTAFVLEVQYFGKKGAFPADALENLVRQLERPTVVDQCYANHVAILYADAVQDLTGLLGNDQQTEPRAAVDLHCRYTAQVIDDPGYIDEVSAVMDVVDPETGETTIEITGKLIHGNLISGEEPDLARSLDVDFSASAKDKTKG